MITYKEMLEEARLERKHQQDMLKYVDKDFVESVGYKIKALDSEIKALEKRTEVEENAKAKMEKSAKNNSIDWNSFILSIVRQP